MKIHQFKYFVGLTLGMLVFATACNKNFDTVIPESPENDGSIQYKVPKVLYLIVDGARGASVRDAEVPTLRTLINHSIYTWTGLADNENATDAANWADMLTGVKKEKHNVLAEDFAGNKLAEYPVIFERIKSLKPNMRIAAFASSDVFKAKLTGGADVSESFGGNDEAVTARIAEFVKTDTAALVVGEFNGVEKAGKASGFDNSFPAYKAAINKFDSQVGEILTALKSRANFENENWLVIVTSNKGGQFTLPVEEDDKTIFSNTSANTFTIIYNASYNPTFIVRPFLGTSYSGSAIRFKGDPEKIKGTVSAEKSPSFNFGDSTDFTVSVKIKKGRSKDTSKGEYWYEWPSVVGKRNNSAWGQVGWNICLFYNGWRFFGAGGQDNSNGDEVGGLDFSGETWHDLTFVIEMKADGNRYIRLYTDGVKGITNKDGANAANPTLNDFKLSGHPNYNNNDPLTVGFVGGDVNGNRGYINVNLSELKIWKTALPESVIKQYSCDPTMDESHPYYDYLVGYWPMVDGSGDKIVDNGPFSADFSLEGPYAWEQFTDLMCTPSNTNLGVLVPKNSDVPSQILSWFNIPRQESWGLDGRVWIAN